MFPRPVILQFSEKLFFFFGNLSKTLNFELWILNLTRRRSDHIFSSLLCPYHQYRLSCTVALTYITFNVLMFVYDNSHQWTDILLWNLKSMEIPAKGFSFFNSGMYNCIPLCTFTILYEFDIFEHYDIELIVRTF